MRWRMDLGYDGSAFHGWQLQSDAATVQGELERVAGVLFGTSERVRIYGSGRTDSGVHALGQVAHFDAPVHRDARELLKGFRALVPDGITLWALRAVEDDFHARFQARERSYRYRLLRTPDPFFSRFGWPLRSQVHWEVVESLAEELHGEHDFRGYATKPDPGEKTVCHLQRLEISEDRLGWVVTIVADRFLRRMVRTIVGTLLEVGSGVLAFDDALGALHSPSAGRCGTPAPAKGLALYKVRYGGGESPPERPLSPWSVMP